MKRRDARATEGAGRNQVDALPARRVTSLEELVAQIVPENRMREIKSGPEVGREIVEWRKLPSRL
jgi:antitoxin component of MazEF toxin-antitoxin module